MREEAVLEDIAVFLMNGVLASFPSPALLLSTLYVMIYAPHSTTPTPPLPPTSRRLGSGPSTSNSP